MGFSERDPNERYYETPDEMERAAYDNGGTSEGTFYRLSTCQTAHIDYIKSNNQYLEDW